MDNTAGNSMMDEFGDYSFFQDIQDVDENGKVITVNSNNNSKKDSDNNDNKGDNNEGSMEDEFGDDAFLANVEIDDTGNVVPQKKEEQHDNTGAVSSPPLRNERRSEDEIKREASRQTLVTARSLLHRKKLDDSSDEEEDEDVNPSAARPTSPKRYSYSQEEAKARNGDPPVQREDHELDSLAAMKALGAPETDPVPETTEAVVDFWEPSSWGSPQRKRTADEDNNTSGSANPIGSPASVLVNPYSPRKKRMTPQRAVPRKASGGTPNKKQGQEPERFIVYG